MGQKLCVGSSDTLLVTLSCNIIRLNRSPNVNVDVTDGGDEDEKENARRQCCCLSW
jgi:hypothetical protein